MVRKRARPVMPRDEWIASVSSGDLKVAVDMWPDRERIYNEARICSCQYFCARSSKVVESYPDSDRVNVRLDNTLVFCPGNHGHVLKSARSDRCHCVRQEIPAALVQYYPIFSYAIDDCFQHSRDVSQRCRWKRAPAFSPPRCARSGCQDTLSEIQGLEAHQSPDDLPRKATPLCKGCAGVSTLCMLVGSGRLEKASRRRQAARSGGPDACRSPQMQP